MVEGKEKGLTQSEAFANIKKTVPKNFPTELQILKDIVQQIYTAEYANHLSSDGALSAYEADCESQQ